MNEIVGKFDICGTVATVRPLGEGLINDTFLVRTSEAECPDYVLQRINHSIFPDVDLLMKNILAVTRHLRGKLEAAGEKDIDRKVLRFIPLKEGRRFYWTDGEECWRLMVFIPNAITQQAVTPESAEAAGRAFGKFQSDLADLPVQLDETIRNFHNMEFRLQQLREAVAGDVAGRVKEVQQHLDELERRAEAMCLAERLGREGRLPKRICHCDTKVNNMMFDADGSVLCVIDLDTVMPNFVFSDYGDFLRTAANTADENEADLQKVHFAMDIFQAFTRGYLASASAFLTPVEVELLPFAVALFPYMQCVRFLTNYINGDKYYKTSYPTHNLVRAYNQFRLLQCVEANADAMKDYIAACLR